MEKPKILIIDDDPANIRLLELILKNENFNIISALNGEYGIHLAKEENPNIIILDIMMPKMDGYQVCKKLKKAPDTKNIPVFFITAKTDSEGVVKGFKLGAADYITRPFNRLELLTRIKTQLTLKKSQDIVLELERQNSIMAMGTTTNHEINQPLTVLTGNLYLLKDSMKWDSLNKEQQNSFKKMDKAIMKIKKILERYQNPKNAKYKPYKGSEKLVVFDD